MKGYRLRVADQYFEEFLKLEAVLFADVGGFDGDTTAEELSAPTQIIKQHLNHLLQNLNKAKSSFYDMTSYIH